MRYLSVDDVVEINETFARGAVEPADIGLLEMAVLRPMTSLVGMDGDAYHSVHEKAAALFHSLVCNHAFHTGNKRTAVVALGVFLRINGWRLVADDGDVIGLALDTAEGLLDVPTIAKWCAAYSIDEREPNELSDEDE